MPRRWIVLALIAVAPLAWELDTTTALVVTTAPANLYKEIKKGKANLGPRTPVGAGDTHPGRRGDPAPGQPDAQADPYDVRAQR